MMRVVIKMSKVMTRKVKMRKDTILKKMIAIKREHLMI